MNKLLTNKTKEQMELMLNNFEKLNKNYLQEVIITNEFAGHCFDIGQKVLLLDIVDVGIPLYIAADVQYKQKCLIQEDEFVI